MKTQLNAHKYKLLSVLFVFILFFLSINVRNEKLRLPLSTEYEWTTAHVLITLQIWNESGGPQAYGFRPIYTYPGKGNKHIYSLGGVADAEGNLYYTSYPPFTFIFAYYATKIIGGPDLTSIRIMGLMLHFMCTLLLFLIILSLQNEKKDRFLIAPVVASALYLFSAGTLWMHSILYFSDTLVQLFILSSIYLVLLLLKTHSRRQTLLLILLGISTFLGVYTEWLAVFFAFFCGIFFLIQYFISKRNVFLKALLANMIGGALALGITFVQYASISTTDAYLESSVTKYKERSGDPEAAGKFSWMSDDSLLLLENNLDRNFALVINLSGIMAVLLLGMLLWKKQRVKIKHLKTGGLLLLLTTLSVLLHYLLFFNFNAIHNFSNLKTGFLMIFFIALVCLYIESALKWWGVVIIGLLMVYVGTTRGIREIQRFHNFYSIEDFSRDREISAALVKKHSNPDQAIYTNLFVTPEYMYKVHHNCFYIQDTSHISFLMKNFQVKKALYFHHTVNKPEYMLDLTLDNGKLEVQGRTDFIPDKAK